MAAACLGTRRKETGMGWIDLDSIWRRAMTLAWTSFCEGNLPIAAILTDADGRIVS